MTPRTNTPKKPSGGRPNVRRLFSKDTFTSQHSSEAISTSGKDVGSEKTGRASTDTGARSRWPPLDVVTEKAYEERSLPWMSKETIDSPASANTDALLHDSPASRTDSLPASDSSATHGSDSAQITMKRNKPIPVYVPPRDEMISPPPSSTPRARWATLRRAVLPPTTSSISTADSDTASRVTSPTPSFQSFSQLNLPGPRPSTPKPSRLARFGFKHVVVEAREAADDITRRFAEDIRRACWTARFGDIRQSKPEREPTQPILGSALHLPFMSSASLPLAGSQSASNFLGQNAVRQPIRRPPSTLSLSSQPSRSFALAGLQTVIVRYASVANNKETTYDFLPHEKEALSALLISFLSPSTGRIVDEERRLSLEIFETIVKTWRARDAETEIERCMWCCRAAIMPPSPLRSRILLNLESLLTPRELILTTPIAFRTILPGLAFLVPHYHETTGTNDLRTVYDLIEKVISGKCGRLDLEDLEQKYQGLALNSDSESDLRQGICIEGLSRCLELASHTQLRPLLDVVEKFWPLPDVTRQTTPLRSKIHVNKIVTFLRSALKLLYASLNFSSPHPISAAESGIILRLLTTRIIPEIGILHVQESGGAQDARSLTVKTVLALMGFNTRSSDDADFTFSDSMLTETTDLFLNWLHKTSSDWQGYVENELKNLASSADWLVVIPIATNVIDALSMDSRKRVVSMITPQLQERLLSNAPQKSEALTRLLTLLSQIQPQVFYKPMFLCAASPKETVIAQQYAKLLALSHCMPHFWITDAEMMGVVLMSDPLATEGVGKGKMKEGQMPSWGKPRIGQLMILLEVIGELRAIRLAKQDANLDSSIPTAKIGSFITGLEPRLSVILDAREQVSLLPLSLRMLLATLFLEMRRLSRSLKSATWIKYVVAWAVHHNTSDSSGFSGRWPRITEENRQEIIETFDKVQDVYTASKKLVGGENQSVPLSPRSENPLSEKGLGTVADMIDARVKSLADFPKHSIGPLFDLLVAMSGIIKPDDYARLCPVVWNEGLKNGDSNVIVHACFLCMQCAEKASNTFLGMLTSYMQRCKSPIASTRREAVQKLGILLTWRFQLLSLTVITDRSYRRPFKLARPPISFVPTDVGSSNYVPTEDAEERTSNLGQALPLDLRRRLNEIGWAEEDKPLDLQLAWLRTPMALLGTSQIDALSTSSVDIEGGYMSEHSPSPIASPNSTPSKSSSSDGRVMRRSSSAGHLGVKRRPVFVQPLVAIFLQLATLAMDKNFEVAVLARETLLDLMRDDPAILCRPVIDILSENVADLDVAVTTLRTFLHIRRFLPPRLTHYIFNHLAGFLKFLAKESAVPENIYHLAHLTPILAKITPQVSEMTVQAIRRAKIEIFLFPSGSLWFPDSAPVGPMFPKALPKQSNPFQQVHPTLVHIVTVRTAQNLLFVELLKRYPQDAHIIRKNWSRVALPVIPGEHILLDTIPKRPGKSPDHIGKDEILRLSLSFSRSHLLLVAQMFRSVTRHLNDRDELGIFMDGVNRILTRHSDDIGIVSHCLIAYLIASTRYRRLMSSGGGFKLFLRPLIKVYCEAEADASIRTMIEYAVHRFYAVHEEVFIFQALDVVSTLVSQPTVEGEWIANNAYTLLSTLKNRPNLSQEVAGIRESNKTQEEETALAIAADEMPQMFLASLRKESNAPVENLQTSFSADVFDNKSFRPDDLIRMLLTVIAHDPLVRRAEQFLLLFRFLAQFLYNASGTARNVFRDGIEALGSIILTKVAPKVKSGEARVNANENATLNVEDTARPSSPCDPRTMVSDYIRLFASYVRAGGEPKVSSIHRCLDLVKILLKEDIKTEIATDTIRYFIDNIAESFVMQAEPKHPYLLLKEFSPFIRGFGGALDLSGLLRSLLTMASNPIYANDTQFATIVVNQICSSTLEICDLAASEGALFALPYRNTLVVLLARGACLLGADVISQIEQREPSPEFLVGIVIPFLFRLRTTTELATETQWTDSWRHDFHSKAWVRMLFYVINACQVYSSRGDLKRSNSSSSFRTDLDDGEISRSTSKSKRKSNSRTQFVMSTRLSIALVALKTVILRGETDISSTFPGAWSRVGAFLRSLLREGNASFATHVEANNSPNITPLPSPTVASRSSFSKDHELLGRHRSSASFEAHLSIPFSEGRQSRSLSPGRAIEQISGRCKSSNVRVVDYLTWSLLEFVCMRNSPLMIQLRTFMHEKTCSLHGELSFPGGNGMPSAKVFKPKASLRPISTLFSKPRYRYSKTGSATPTPEASPRLGPSDSGAFASANIPSLPTFFSHNWSNISTDGSARGPAFPNPSSPASPTNGSARLKKRILHLGIQTQLPASNSVGSELSYVSSQDEVRVADGFLDEQQLLAQTSFNSPSLLFRTYERIRIVQASLGYSRLLPIPRDLRAHQGLVKDAGSRRNSDILLGTPGIISASASPRTSVINDDDNEPDLTVWTRRRAQELIFQEAEQLLGVLRADSAMTPSGSDFGHSSMFGSSFHSFDKSMDPYAMSASSTIRVT